MAHPKTKLTWALLNRDRYKTWASEHAPGGATADEWWLWAQWVNARRAAFKVAIGHAMEEKRFNQKEKANERKRHISTYHGY